MLLFFAHEINKDVYFMSDFVQRHCKSSILLNMKKKLYILHFKSAIRDTTILICTMTVAKGEVT